MSFGILRPGFGPDWDQLERAARETIRDMSHDRALNIVRSLPAIAVYARCLEADRRRLERWVASHGMTIEQWRESVDREMGG